MLVAEAQSESKSLALSPTTRIPQGKESQTRKGVWLTTGRAKGRGRKGLVDRPKPCLFCICCFIVFERHFCLKGSFLAYKRNVWTCKSVEELSSVKTFEVCLRSVSRI